MSFKPETISFSSLSVTDCLYSLLRNLNSSFVIGQDINSEIFPGIFSEIPEFSLKYFAISCIEKVSPLKFMELLSLYLIAHI